MKQVLVKRFALVMVLSSAVAFAGSAPDPVTVDAPQPGSKYVLGDRFVLRAGKVSNAKKYDCDVTQGSTRWHHEDEYGTFEMSSTDQAKFKPGPVKVRMRAFYKNKWLAPATSTFEFAHAAAARTGTAMDRLRAEVDKESATATAKFHSVCGCEIPSSVDWTTVPSAGARQSQLFEHAFEALAQIPDIACKTDADKAKMCSSVKSFKMAWTGDMGGDCSFDSSTKVVTCFSHQSWVDYPYIAKAFGMTWKPTPDGKDYAFFW